MPRLRRSLLLSVTSLLVLAPSALADCPSADVVPSGANAPEVRTAIVCLTNVERAAAGLGALTAEARLEAAAQAYAGRMVAEQFFAHVGPDGSTMPQRLGAYTDWTTIGENLAWGEESLSTPRATVAAWMASPGHRANILNGAYTEVGIGVVPGTPNGSDRAGGTYAAEYGHREDAASAPAAAEADAAVPSAPHPAPAPKPAVQRPAAPKPAARKPAARKPAAHKPASCRRATARRATSATARRVAAKCGRAPAARRRA